MLRVLALALCLLASVFLSEDRAVAVPNVDPCYSAWLVGEKVCDNAWLGCCDINWFSCFDITGCAGEWLTCSTKNDFRYFGCKFGYGSIRGQGTYGPSGLWYSTLLTFVEISIGESESGLGAVAEDQDPVVLYKAGRGLQELRLRAASLPPASNPRALVVTAQCMSIPEAVHGTEGAPAPAKLSMTSLGKAKYHAESDSWAITWDSDRWQDSRGYVIEVSVAGHALPGGRAGFLLLAYPEAPPRELPAGSWGAIKRIYR